MRARLVLAMVLAAAAAAGCGRDEVLGPDGPVIPPGIDAPPAVDSPPLPDAAPRLCSSANTTADVTAMGGSGSDMTYNRLYAGALDEVGPVAPGGAPMTITVLFTDVDPFDADRWSACEGLDVPNCSTVGLIARLPSLAPGTEVGAHAVTFTKTDNTGFTLMGTVTIDTFVDPFTSSPGQIAGSVTGSMGGRTVTGTFDNEFCLHLLTATI